MLISCYAVHWTETGGGGGGWSEFSIQKSDFRRAVFQDQQVRVHLCTIKCTKTHRYMHAHIYTLKRVPHTNYVAQRCIYHTYKFRLRNFKLKFSDSFWSDKLKTPLTFMHVVWKDFQRGTLSFKPTNLRLQHASSMLFSHDFIKSSKGQIIFHRTS